MEGVKNVIEVCSLKKLFRGKNCFSSCAAKFTVFYCSSRCYSYLSIYPHSLLPCHYDSSFNRIPLLHSSSSLSSRSPMFFSSFHAHLQSRNPRANYNDCSCLNEPNSKKCKPFHFSCSAFSTCVHFETNKEDLRQEKKKSKFQPSITAKPKTNHMNHLGFRRMRNKIKIVKSLNNPIIKHFLKLSSNRSYRDNKGTAIVSSKKLITELSKNNFVCKSIVCNKKVIKGFYLNEILCDNITFTTDRVLKKICGLFSYRGGIAGEFDIPKRRSDSLFHSKLILCVTSFMTEDNILNMKRKELLLSSDGKKKNSFGPKAPELAAGMLDEGRAEFCNKHSNNGVISCFTNNDFTSEHLTFKNENQALGAADKEHEGIIGNLIRTAFALKFHSIVFIKNSFKHNDDNLSKNNFSASSFSNLFSPLNIRASQGALFHMLYSEMTWEEFLSFCMENKIAVCTAATAAQNRCLNVKEGDNLDKRSAHSEINSQNCKNNIDDNNICYVEKENLFSGYVGASYIVGDVTHFLSYQKQKIERSLLKLKRKYSSNDEAANCDKFKRSEIEKNIKKKTIMMNFKPKYLTTGSVKNTRNSEQSAKRYYDVENLHGTVFDAIIMYNLKYKHFPTISSSPFIAS